MAQVVQGLLEIKMTDWSKESMQFSFPIAEINAANYAAAITAIGTFRTALAAVTLGAVNVEKISCRRTSEVPPLTPASSVAQREASWWCIFQDNVNGKRFSVRIPTPDLVDATLQMANTDTADLTNADWVAFKTAVQAIIRSEDNNACTLLSVHHVGKDDRKSLTE